MEKSIEKSSKQFLENSGLKVYNFLEKSGYGKPINFATEYDMKDGIYTGNISFELVIFNCTNIEDIIEHCESIISCEFSIMKKESPYKYDDYMLSDIPHNCYKFIFHGNVSTYE